MVYREQKSAQFWMFLFVLIFLIQSCVLIPKETSGKRQVNGGATLAQKELPVRTSNLPFTESQQSEIQIEVWTDKRIYKVGEPVYLFIRSKTPTYFTVLNIGTTGQTQILFPNSIDSDNYISANQVYRIPKKGSGFLILTEDPPGIEQILVIATPTQVPFSKWVHGVDKNEGSQLESFKLEDIVEKLRKEGWGMNNTQFRVLEEKIIDPPSGEQYRSIEPKPIDPKPPGKPIDIIGVPGIQQDKSAKSFVAKENGLAPSEQQEKKVLSDDNTE